MMRLGVILSGPATPALLLNVYHIEDENLKKILQIQSVMNSKLEEVQERNKYLHLVRQKLLFYKQAELVTEISIQLTLQTIMLLLNGTTTSTTTGLQEVFKNDNLVWKIVLSVCWSFMTILTTYTRIKTLEKNGFLPIKAKIALGLKALLTSGTIVWSIIAFFASYLGLFSLLGHWKEELKPFRPPGGLDWQNETFMYSGTTIPLSNLYR